MIKYINKRKMVVTVTLSFLFTLLERLKAPQPELGRKKSILLWVVMSALLFVCWIPCFLAGYPGF